MNNQAFSTPQRQSVLGVALIFFTTLYKIFRGFWVLGVYLILNTPSGATLTYIVLGTGFMIVLVLGYSYVYYRNFLFHIDYAREEFILQKGVISTENLAISFDKIQQVYFKRSLLQRLIGVYSVVVDTAGSKSDEVSISAISREDANLLLSILTRVKKDAHPATSEQEVETPPVPQARWTHTLDVITLLKIGVSTNYVRGLALVLAFFTTIYNEMNSLFRNYAEEFSEYYDSVPDVSNSTAFVGFLLVFLLVISILITVLEVFFKYYGLTLTQTRESLELEMGLKTNTKVTLQPRRVQLLQVITNPVQRRMNLYEARIALASSENTLQKKKIKIPGLDHDTVLQVKSFLYGDVAGSFEKTFKPHVLMLYRRLIIVLIPLIVSYFLLYLFEYMNLYLWAGLALVYLIFGVIYQVIWYRSLEIKFSDEFLYKNQGVWNKRRESFEIYKMQAITVTQPFWYKRRNLINLNFHTAGGDMSFRAVDKSIIPYLNYLLYKIESSQKRWM